MRNLLIASLILFTSFGFARADDVEQATKEKTQNNSLKIEADSKETLDKKEKKVSEEAKEKKQSLLFLEAYKLHKQNKPKQALAEYKKVIKKEPNNSLAWNNIGLIQQELGKDKLAEQAYEKAIKLDPNEVQAVNNLASLKLSEGKVIEAKTLYNQAIQKDPDYPYSYSNLANLYKSYGSKFEAVEYYKKAIDKAPVAEFYYRLGLLYFEMKRYEDMFETFQRAVKDDPQCPEAVYSLCLTHFYNLMEYPKEKQKELFTKAFDQLKDLDSNLAKSFQQKVLTQE